MDPTRHVAQVKNKAPAQVQITAEQLLREAQERQEIPEKPAPEIIADEEELLDYRQRKRKGFEDALRRNRQNYGAWIRYAEWEEGQQEWERARSVFERALVQDYRNHTLWMRFAEMEMRNKFVNHARNVWDRAVTLLPRVDQFWYKFAYMEEMLGNIAGARQIYERWMQWEPEPQAWFLYIKLEKRYNEWQRVREIFNRFVAVHPDAQHWLKWTKFEEELGEHENCRAVFTRALETLGDDFMTPHLYISFAKFETRMKEHDRARAIFQYALEHLAEKDKPTVFAQFTQFQKQFSTRDGIEDVILRKKRDAYEAEVGQNPFAYDSWFEYARLEEDALANAADDPVETEKAIVRCREVYERAVANVPMVKEKKYWRRYIYLWLRYAIFEELTIKDLERSRKVYRACLDLVPNKLFAFAKIWLLYAHFEVRQGDVTTARKYLGRSLGQCPKPKLFKGYIQLELDMREFDRCRKLYEQFLKYSPQNAYAWIKFAELETLLDDVDRARALYDLAVQQPVLDMPELLWKSYIDFETSQGEFQRVRALYRQLTEKSAHPKVFMSLAEFEMSVLEDRLREEDEENTDGMQRSRRVLEDGYAVIKDKGDNEHRRIMLELWIAFEDRHSSAHSLPSIVQVLRDKLPQQVKKRRRVDDELMEEYFDLVFPEDEAVQAQGVSKLLAMAKKWKEEQARLESAKQQEQD